MYDICMMKLQNPKPKFVGALVAALMLCDSFLLPADLCVFVLAPALHLPLHTPDVLILMYLQTERTQCVE